MSAQCDMMTLNAKLNYRENCQCVKLEYTNKLCTYVILPKADIKTFIKDTFSQKLFESFVE